MEHAVSNCSNGEVRLVGGATEQEGRVEVCVNRIWGTVCSSTQQLQHAGRLHAQWDIRDARVVCNQLGYQGM